MTRPAVTMEEINAFLAAELPFCVQMRLTCVRVAVDVAVARLDYDAGWARPGGILSGAALMTLADVAVYIAVFTRTGIVPLAVTNELKMNFLRPVIGRDVLAVATLHKVGRRIAFAAVEISEANDTSRLVAHATATYVLPGTG